MKKRNQKRATPVEKQGGHALPEGMSKEEKAIWRMVQEGRANWSGGKPQGLKKPIKVRGKPVSQIVLEERR